MLDGGLVGVDRSVSSVGRSMCVGPLAGRSVDRSVPLDQCWSVRLGWSVPTRRLIVGLGRFVGATAVMHYICKDMLLPARLL